MSDQAGLGKGFAPSATAANAALGGTVKQDKHPPGTAGTTYSLTEMARLIRDGRNDPRVRAFAGRTISRAEAMGLAKNIDPSAWVESDKLPTGGFVVRAKNKTKEISSATAATLAHAWQELSVRLRGIAGLAANYGKLKTAVQQAQAILDEIRRVTHYLQDPCGTELIATPARTLCLDDHGLCLTSSDCDDRCVAFASSTLSIGIDTQLIGAAYGTPQATHVLCRILDDDGNWQNVDPSSEKFEVGKSHPASKEWVVDIISGSIADPNGVKTTMGKEPDHGDFIGVGAVPFPHAFSEMGKGAAYPPSGLIPNDGMLDGGIPCFPECSEGPDSPTGLGKAERDFAFPQHLVQGLGKEEDDR
jgi:hypothetical protein